MLLHLKGRCPFNLSKGDYSPKPVLQTGSHCRWEFTMSLLGASIHSLSSRLLRNGRRDSCVASFWESSLKLSGRAWGEAECQADAIERGLIQFQNPH